MMHCKVLGSGISQQARCSTCGFAWRGVAELKQPHTHGGGGGGGSKLKWDLSLGRGRQTEVTCSLAIFPSPNSGGTAWSKVSDMDERYRGTC